MELERKGRTGQPSDAGSVKSRSWYASTISLVNAGEEPGADFITCVSGMKQTDAPTPSPTPKEQDALFP